MQSVKSNERLKELFEQDQQYRSKGALSLGNDTELLSSGDSDEERQEEVLKLYKTGAIVTRGDFWRAGAIMQHANSYERLALSHQFAIQAVHLGQPPMLSLLARSTDRLLIKQQQDAGVETHHSKQRFGTNFTLNHQQLIEHVFDIEAELDDWYRFLLGIISISPFLGHPILEYYEARDKQVEIALAEWQDMFQDEQLRLSEDLIRLAKFLD